MIIGLKMWALERTQSFPKIWASDLVFYPTWPIFELIQDFIKTNILTKFHDNQTENVKDTRIDTDGQTCWYGEREKREVQGE